MKGLCSIYIFFVIFYLFGNLCPDILDSFSSRRYQVLDTWIEEIKRKHSYSYAFGVHISIRMTRCRTFHLHTISKHQFQRHNNLQLASEIKNYHLAFFIWNYSFIPTCVFSVYSPYSVFVIRSFIFTTHYE